MKAIAVCTWYNNEADGSPVADDLQFDDPAYPKTYHGPFETIEEAVDWMNDVWPDGDTDVAEQEVAEYEVEPEWLNSPDSLLSS